MKAMRPVMLVAAIVLVAVALLLFSKFKSMANPASEGFPYILGSILSLVGAIGCGIGWVVTRPKENMDDISITKF